MKKLIVGFSALLLISCSTTGEDCNPGSKPGAPHGTPDDVSNYEGSDGYRSVTYTYNCHNGQYVSYTYVRSDACSDWQQDSKYTSDGICKSK